MRHIANGRLFNRELYEQNYQQKSPYGLSSVCVRLWVFLLRVLFSETKTPRILGTHVHIYIYIIWQCLWLVTKRRNLPQALVPVKALAGLCAPRPPSSSPRPLSHPNATSDFKAAFLHIVIWLFWAGNPYFGACCFCFWSWTVNGFNGSHSKLLALWLRLAAWFQTAGSLKWVSNTGGLRQGAAKPRRSGCYPPKAQQF